MRIPVAARITTASALRYPTSDGAPMAETQVHVDLIANLLPLLRHFFRRRKKTYVAGNIFLYWEEGHPRKRRAPDIMVVKGVDAARKRLNFKTWEEKAVPSFILEVTSKKTVSEDLGAKKEIYRSLGVNEYFLFDPLGESLSPSLMGFRHKAGEYEELEVDSKGAIVSAELGIRFVPRGSELQLVGQRNGKMLLPPTEAYEELDRVNKKLDDYARKIEELEAELRKKQS